MNGFLASSYMSILADKKIEQENKCRKITAKTHEGGKRKANGEDEKVLMAF